MAESKATRDGRGLSYVAAAAERYRLALDAEALATRAKEEARDNLEAVIEAAFRSGAEVEDLKPFPGAMSALYTALRRVMDRLDYP